LEILTGFLAGVLITVVTLGGVAGLLWLLAGSRSEKAIICLFDRFWGALERKSKKAAEEKIK
jgi:hypothetical protein